MKPKEKFSSESELLVLSDGRILAHNITPEMAAVLSELDPENELMQQRAARTGSTGHWPVPSGDPPLGTAGDQTFPDAYS